jgi:hypothetical protein
MSKQFSLVRLQTFKNVTRIFAKDFKMVSEKKTAGIKTWVLGLMSYCGTFIYSGGKFSQPPTSRRMKGVQLFCSL